MLGRRRQSIHGGFGQLNPQKGLGPFSRNLGSSHGQTLSPRASSHNLNESHNRLSSVVESPTAAERRDSTAEKENAKTSHEGTNGATSGAASNGTAHPVRSSSLANGTAEDIFDAPPVPPLPQQSQGEPAKDADGFTIPVSTNDPISQAQKDAASEEGDQLFKLNIKNEPIAEEDQDAKQAALSNVANALTHMGMPSRKSGTVRGRRDVRNTVYMPSLPIPEPTSENPFPSPSLPAKLTAATSLTSEMSHASHASDTQSIRSGTSFGGASSYSTVARLKHPEMHGPGYGPGLHSSIIETVSAVFQDAEPKSVKVTGEIALSYVPDPDNPFPRELRSKSSSFRPYVLTVPAAEHEVIRLNKFSLLESIGPNRVFVANTPAPDEFSINLSHISNTTSPAFTFRVHADSDTSLASHCPIVIKPAWKPQGDKLGLLLQYRRNPAASSLYYPGPVTLSNVVFVMTYEGARASGVQTKPSGTHLKDKHLVYWRLGDVTLGGSGNGDEDGDGGGAWEKIICRVIGEQNAEPRPGHVEVRWEYSPPLGAAAAAAGDSNNDNSSNGGGGISVARLIEGKGKEKEAAAVQASQEEDPFADVEQSSPGSPPADVGGGKSWVDVPLVRKVVSGKYEAR